jgi:hypothetical protein
MNAQIKGKTTLEVVGLLLKHDPKASDEQLGDVVSEWGHLLDDSPAEPAKPVQPAHGEDGAGAPEKDS